MIFNTENHVKNLPDAYDKRNSSNNYKILELERQTLNEIRDNIADIDDSLDINEAYGKTLDYYGAMVGQPRGVATDEQYVTMIKSKIEQNLSNGTYPSVVKAICNTFNCEASQVLIEENDSPCVVDIITMPLAAITRANLTVNQTIAIIRRLLPICVTIESYLFEGTFEFSESETDYDADAGFCDVEDGTLGGYLGIIYGEENEPILPI